MAQSDLLTLPKLKLVPEIPDHQQKEVHRPRCRQRSVARLLGVVMKNRTIMVVEDYDDTRVLLRQGLELIRVH